jgi:isopenicillin N synthase-like dioxygenase
MHPVVDSWIPVPTRPDTYVVNIGDVLGAWTSGQYRSATHRVVNQSNDDRYSVPFFYDGTMSARMDSLDGSGDPKSCKTVGQHFKEKFTAADSVRQ